MNSMKKTVKPIPHGSNARGLKVGKAVVVTEFAVVVPKSLSGILKEP